MPTGKIHKRICSCKDRVVGKCGFGTHCMKIEAFVRYFICRTAPGRLAIGVKIDQQRGQSDEGTTTGSGWGGEPNLHSASGQH